MQFRPHTVRVAVIAVAVLSSAHADVSVERLRLDVFTTEDSPVQGEAEFLRHHPKAILRVHRVDRIAQLEAELSLNLSVDPDQAEQQALRRLQNQSSERQDELQQTAKSLALALQLGIKRVPAIVIDQERVIYGLTDLAAALKLDQSLLDRRSP